MSLFNSEIDQLNQSLTKEKKPDFMQVGADFSSQLLIFNLVEKRIEDLQQRQKFIEKFALIAEIIADFHADRPALNDDYGTLKKLLENEVSELNGVDKSGLFAQIINREDYRQQEVADIAIFAIELLRSLDIFQSRDNNKSIGGQKPGYTQLKQGEAFNQAVDTIWQHTNNFMRQYQIDWPQTETMPTIVPLFDNGKDNGGEAQKYEQLRIHINEVVNNLMTIEEESLPLAERTATNLLAQSETDLILQTIALTIVLFSLLKVDFAAAIKEKITRNYMKFPAAEFSTPFKTTEELREKMGQLGSAWKENNYTEEMYVINFPNVLRFAIQQGYPEEIITAAVQYFADEKKKFSLA